MKPLCSPETFATDAHFQELKERVINHYAQLAMNPATVHHARWQVSEMQKEQSGLWVGLGILIAQRIEHLKDKT
jgi:hypothetical protein